MSHGFAKHGRQYDKEYKEKFKDEWFNWDSPPPPYSSTDLNMFLSSNKSKPKVYII